MAGFFWATSFGRADDEQIKRYNLGMRYHALYLGLFAFGARAEGWLYDSRGGAAIYFILLLLAILAWLSFQFRNWFGWLDEKQRGPLRLGITDPRSNPESKFRNRGAQTTRHTNQREPKNL